MTMGGGRITRCCWISCGRSTSCAQAMTGTVMTFNVAAPGEYRKELLQMQDSSGGRELAVKRIRVLSGLLLLCYM